MLACVYQSLSGESFIDNCVNKIDTFFALSCSSPSCPISLVVFISLLYLFCSRSIFVSSTFVVHSVKRNGNEIGLGANARVLCVCPAIYTMYSDSVQLSKLHPDWPSSTTASPQDRPYVGTNYHLVLQTPIPPNLQAIPISINGVSFA